ncbi:hypothetical protein PVAR5_1233 [Paecilomyces variotii No. 5]|uniref:Uncharacterized protein n=1 Tax=Byssochlamys spectabilis (strain No. 5 / NBRC 109023) TaxID=1356009 RepID=V5HT28_BYSSN|nr:hypothetical protein PVAR5_1233 [Paecilomyces variotii No. 5]
MTISTERIQERAMLPKDHQEGRLLKVEFLDFTRCRPAWHRRSHASYHEKRQMAEPLDLFSSQDRGKLACRNQRQPQYCRSDLLRSSQSLQSNRDIALREERGTIADALTETFLRFCPWPDDSREAAGAARRLELMVLKRLAEGSQRDRDLQLTETRSTRYGKAGRSVAREMTIRDYAALKNLDRAQLRAALV